VLITICDNAAASEGEARASNLPCDTWGLPRIMAETFATDGQVDSRNACGLRSPEGVGTENIARARAASGRFDATFPADRCRSTASWRRLVLFCAILPVEKGICS
jgi:hypothetical protein